VTDLAPVTFLAHAGEGASWQALLTTISLGLVVVLVLVLLGRIRLESPGDLILPLAAVAIVSSLAPTVSATLSDWVGWAFPIGVVVLVGLVVAAATPLTLGWTTPLTLAVVLLAAGGSVGLHDSLSRAWHPTPETLPLADDGEVTIASPSDDSTVPAGDVDVVIEVTGATVGPGGTLDSPPDDPEELGRLRVFLDGVEVATPAAETCTVEQPCTTLTYPLELDPGAHNVIVEYLRHDGIPLSPAVFDRVTVEAEG
jgi:hypothetical protein